MFASTGFTLLTFAVLLGGMIAHAAKQFHTARMNKASLSVRGYFLEHWPETLIGVVGSLVLWAGLPEIAQKFPDLAKSIGLGTDVGILSSFACGFVGNSLADIVGGRAKTVALGD